MFFPNVLSFLFYCLLFRDILKAFFQCRSTGKTFSQFSFTSECLDFPLFAEGYFSWVQDSQLSFVCLLVCLFQHLKIVCHFLLVFTVSDEKSAVIQIVFPLQVRCNFSLAAFKIFFFVFSFQKFDYDVSELGPSWIYPFWGFAEDLK